ncbi:MAG: recombination mediator RecR [Rhabdochlamydiaceae bacterium]|nr:recombination mediator RecR [Rhabdochlamydiaceae bacterium]
MAKFPHPIQKFIMQLRKLPGVGAKTAERYAFEMLSWEPEAVQLFSQALQSLQVEIQTCSHCCCLKGETECDYCNPTKRDSSLLCIVSSAKDIYPIEETRIFRGMYHVLGAVLSPLHGYNTEQIDIKKIKLRIQSQGVTDVILALDSTIEGDATSLFLKEELQTFPINISRLAFGIPLGSSLDYVDSGTLTRAFLGRHRF